MQLTVIYPAFNEEENVKHIPNELIRFLDKLGMTYEILIIDDGSKDNTVNEVNKLRKKFSNIVLIRHKSNKGLGSAIRTGIKHARGEFLVTIDGDFTFHPSMIKSLIQAQKRENADCVIGSPLLAGYGKNVPKYRIFLSKSVNKIYQILMQKKVTAVSQIFRLYKARDLKSLDLESKRFDINAEILFKLVQKNKTFYEIPAKLTLRKYGESKINNFKEIQNHIRLIFKIIKWKIFRSTSN
ncbi:TPA: glycosyltransferase family 2 protein [Candidatus Woesearchaeota archaeon]|nr:hypothetical protein [uncultured archaeon]MBS3172823.1 glycosyltransferase family 2 protein [Candidatus Woesearchaeota archaeon]HIH32363.1 glycosyltransferase family 2 protein [Candidatus Woesearchaeota archaeon]HIH54538.1 glycosyltransferase family 2 protein [Candidatus Woesearchaeota archaeon]HIJ02240.1 glycosyltransferase family 2 protein [Candidatus Woesearchaeota archaeon]